MEHYYLQLKKKSITQNETWYTSNTIKSGFEYVNMKKITVCMLFPGVYYRVSSQER